MMIGTILTVAGIGGLMYFLTKSESGINKEIKLQVESKNNNTKDEGKHKLNILRERYFEVFEVFEILEKSDVLKTNSYSNSDLKNRINENIKIIKTRYLNNGIITSEEEKTKRLIEYLDLLIEKKIKIIGLNSLLSLYNSSSIPEDILEGVDDVVRDLLNDFRVKEQEIDDRAKVKAERLLDALKNENNSFDLIEDINNKDNISLHLGEGKASEGDISSVNSNLRNLLGKKENGNEDWD